jgi:D-serine deaminase-like pyridoxal phosphate-dependent protein
MTTTDPYSPTAGTVALKERLDRATAGLQAPFAVVDLDAYDRNTDDIFRRAGGTALRVASKSVRCRALVDRVLGRSPVAGIMSFSLAEAVWLVEHGATDVLMGYPTVDVDALRQLRNAENAAGITLMVDDAAQLDVIEGAVGPDHPPIRLCIDLDGSWRPLGIHVGVRRSPLRTPEDVLALARDASGRGGFEVRGIMTYEAQIAGLQDSSAAIRWMKRRSAPEIAERRAAVVAALSAELPVTLVNAGGTGSLELSSSYPEVTEVTAGSGLYAPGLFDGYRSFHAAPAAAFALPVVRKPAPDIATLFGGGYIASGPYGGSRLPTPFLPDGLTMIKSEGAGEVQTPVRGRAAGSLQIGDRVWLRHAKGGELCERFNELHLVSGDAIVDTVPTYRGEGKVFG